ncbi:50S ribosomal protein L15 [archaeon]|nr:50S ribosomal protein L15 [archaeon]|tara:strand:- start:1275 stop:1688 length:414 start_codon:yes stop_codon:yes gene_type:complete
MINKRKKFSRQRGTHSHGWGSKKKHRGAGNRGGRGMAGTGKRADHKKPTILKEFGSSYFGKRGFKRPVKTQKQTKIINFSDLNKLKSKIKDNTLDLKKLGYTKLLSQGTPTKLKIIVPEFSKKAQEKLEKVGGELTK